MAIAQSDIQYRLSGGASNAVPAASLGGAKSSNAASASIFDNISGAEAAAGAVDHRCVYIHNAHATLTLDNAVAWLNANTPSASTIIEIGIGTSAMNGTEQSVANESTAPTGVTFTSPANKAAGVALGSIPPGQSRAVWLRRTTTAGAGALASDTALLRSEGDSAA